ncbi:uncharacterized protein LOC116297600 [Actinia tenebrosa]|uniref:Uncharacterized protein LOC116297600 n=1 Tax=Actinia tenebrosa TaxID=6105 RepID=A0A6P8IAJ5_ACTTE|nr:uncharacterized protein LOC116297600 [Actinia tenebrosa]
MVPTLTTYFIPSLSAYRTTSNTFSTATKTAYKMLLKSVMVFMLLIAVVSACGGGGRRGGGGGGGGGSGSNCRTTCRMVCYRIRVCRPSNPSHCPVSTKCFRKCTNPCRSVKKRSIPEDKVILQLPSTFTFYDSDKDGGISLEEFARAIEWDQEKANEMFELIDTDSDKRIACDEFKKALKGVDDTEPSC